MFTPTTTPLGTNSDKLKPYIYAPEHIPLVWEEMEAMLQPCIASAGGMLSAQDLYQWLSEGRATAFSTARGSKLEAVLVVCKASYATYSVARIVACAGKNLIGAMAFVDALEAWALTQGCVEIEAWVDTPMLRLSRRLGWKFKKHIVTRDLRRKLQ